MSAQSQKYETIGRYIVDEQLGEGAMADVYRAHDPEIDRTVAIKVLKDELCVDEEYVMRFLREAKAAGTISHPNIVTIFDVGRVGNNPYITMEFLDEQDLGDVLEQGGKLPLKRVLNIGIQLSKALDYAHKQGVVHRDVKPANILFTRSNDMIKVADFGIARMSGTEEINRTQAGTVLGTPRYMSPEQALGSEIDGRSDLFSVGVILYELVTGKKAFDAGSMTTLLLQITQQEPEPIKKVAPDLAVGMQRIISKLLNKRPEKRFQTGAEVAAALQRELDSLIEQEEEADRNKFIPLRIKWAAGSALVVGIVLLVSMLGVLYQQGQAIQDQVLDSGASLAKFIATDAAVPVLSEDWGMLEIDVKNASERDTFVYLTIADNTGTVRAATDPELIGQSYAPPGDAELIRRGDDFTAFVVDAGDEGRVFKFDTPILFMYQGEPREIGQVYLALSREGLEDVMSTTRLLMVLLAVITLVVVVGMLYVFGGLLSGPMKRLRRAMKDLGDGDLDQRISDVRNDEFGELFLAFNRMADALHANLTARERDPAEQTVNQDAPAVAPALASEAVPDAVDTAAADATVMARPAASKGDPAVDATVIAGHTSGQAPAEDPFAQEDEESVDATVIAGKVPRKKPDAAADETGEVEPEEDDPGATVVVRASPKE
ncbi:MAG: protein kinase domain-containing protein [Alphaproteobacteria bacterium]